MQSVNRSNRMCVCVIADNVKTKQKTPVTHFVSLEEVTSVSLAKVMAKFS